MADRLRDERVRGQERHHLLTQLLAASPSGVVFLDLDQKVAFANPAAERWLGPGPQGQPLAALAEASPTGAGAGGAGAGRGRGGGACRAAAGCAAGGGRSWTGAPPAAST